MITRLMNRHPLREANLQEGEEGAAGAGDDKINLAELAKTVGGLTELMGSLGSSVKELSDWAKAMQTKPTNPPDDEDEEEDDDPTDIEAMSRKDFANLILKKMGKHVEKTIKGLSSKVDANSDEALKQRAMMEIAEARKDNPDLDEWGLELKALLTETPGLTLKRALKLAREENPEKATKLKAKYTKAPDDSPARGKVKKFGGLTPGASGTAKTQQMGKTEAANSAWESALSTLDDPAILSGDS